MSNVDVIRTTVDTFNKNQGQLKAIAPHLKDGAALDKMAAHEPFTKMNCKITAIESHGDQVFFTYTATGTHTGDFRNVKATNKTIEWEGSAIATVKDGKIVDVHTTENELAKLIKLGVTQLSMTGNWTTTVLGITINMSLTQNGTNITGTASALGQSFPVTGSNQYPATPNVTLQSQLGSGSSNLLTFNGNFQSASQVQGNYTLGTLSGQATLNKN